jgi:hypothetical protein
MGSSESDEAAELLQRVPPESRALVARLMDEPLLPFTVLRGEVDSYVHLYRAAQRSKESLDVGHAEALAKRCQQLLDAAGDNASEQHRRLLQVAVRYFVIEADGDDDVLAGGLDDDEAVLDAVEELLASNSDKSHD